MAAAHDPPIDWTISPDPIDYAAAMAAMDARVGAIRAGEAREQVWLLEHPSVITAGTSAPPGELLAPDRFPVFASGRGGRHTYHGPGQRVGYVMLDLDARGRDVRRFVAGLEQWVIAALARLDVAARTAPGRIGIWVDAPDGREAKIGAIGVRMRRWVSAHGFALNVAPDLRHFEAIVPCGLADHPVTSLAALGRTTDLAAVDHALAAEFPRFLWYLTASATDS